MRNYCFTWQGNSFLTWLEECLEDLKKKGCEEIEDVSANMGAYISRLLVNLPQLKYAICQIERGGNTGRMHLQGYLEFKGDCRIGTIQRVMPSCHLERRRGTAEQARNYCLKAKTQVMGPWEVGVWSPKEPGKRTDLMNLRRDLERGMDMRGVAQNHFGLFLRYRKAIRSWMDLNWDRKRTGLTRLSVLIGAPGVGKSRLIRELYPKAYWKNTDVWWEQYHGEKVVVVDEFAGQISVTQLNTLVDSIPLLLRVKGSSGNFVAERLIIISNMGLNQWWNWENIRSPKMSVIRRIEELIIWDKDSAPVCYESIEEIRYHVSVDYNYE